MPGDLQMDQEKRGGTRVRILFALMARLMGFLARTVPVSKQVNPACISRTRMVQVNIEVIGKNVGVSGRGFSLHGIFRQGDSLWDVAEKVGRTS